MCTSAMELLAILSPAGVRRALFHVAARHGFLESSGQVRALASDLVDRALSRLAGTSLLTYSVDSSSVSAHRLVARVIREELAARNALVPTCITAARLLEGMADSLGQSWHQDLSAVRDLIEQIMALYESGSDCISDNYLADSLNRLRGWAVWSLNDLADGTMRTIAIAEPLLADRERTLGADHPDTLTTRNNLATAYWRAGRITEAMTLYEQTLAGWERVLGIDHPQTLRTRNNLASAYWTTGRTAEAINSHEQNLADQERVLGPDHPDTLRTRSNLAHAYWTAGRTTEAIGLLENSLADRERVLGKDHPDTLNTCSNLAAAYQMAGRTAEAITMHQQTIASQERVLGSYHPDTLTTRNNLASAYLAAGRTAEAITLYERNLADRKRVLGAGHPDTLSTFNSLTTTKLAADQMTESAFRESLPNAM